MDEDSKPPTDGPVSSTSIAVDSNLAGGANTKRQRAGGGNAAVSGGNPTGVSSAGAGTVSWDLPDIVLAAYLLNPVIAGQCAALSGDVLGRVFPLAALAAAGSRRPGVTAGALAAAACLWRFYAAPLLLPAALMLGTFSCGNVGAATDKAGDKAAAAFDPRSLKVDGKAFLCLSAAFAAWCAAILGVCWLATSGSWAFLWAAARGQLLCEDLTPNIGLYWYFFSEVFPRFRGFFRVLFLSQPYVYVLPATLRLGMFPEALVRT